MSEAAPLSPSQLERTGHIELTEEDVGILHIIVTRAQITSDASQRPFKALFDAYQPVLREKGLDPDHDSTYFRFLLRLGAISGNGSLYEKFEILLDQLGIRLEFEEDTNLPHDVTQNISQDDAERPTATSIPRTAAGAFSETSEQDITYGSFTDNLRPRSQLSFTGISHVGSRHQRAGSFGRSAGTAAARDDPWQASQIGTHRGRMSDPQVPPGLQFKEQGGVASDTRNLALDWASHDDGRMGIVAKPPPAALRHAANAPDSATKHYQSPNMESSLDYYDNSDNEQIHYPAMSSHVSLTAEAFAEMRQLRTARQFIQLWRAKTLDSSKHRKKLEIFAKALDRRTLLRQAVDEWSNKLHERGKTAETEHFFELLERRAGRARDLYLLAKAFTHWAECASDEVQRTSVARRHLIRTKYFNAWREITAVNELKIRRHGLRAYFQSWRKEYVNNLEAQDVAVTEYNHRLALRYIRQWRFSTNESSVMHRLIQNTKATYLRRWTIILQHRRLQEEYAQVVFEKNTTRNCLSTWTRRNRKLQDLQNPCNQVRLATAHRILRASLILWIMRVRTEQQAREVNRLRVLRNAWTQWNDNLRCQTVVKRVDERIVLQNLYKWVLMERYVLFKRIIEHRMKANALRMLMQMVNEHRSRMEMIAEILEENQKRRSLTQMTQHWRNRLQLCREREKVAFEFYAPSLTYSSLQTWRNKQIHAVQLHQWSSDAEFYLKTKKFLRVWRSAVESSRQQKRRVAYSQVRRKSKMNLARKILQAWRANAFQKITLSEHAQQIINDRSVLVLMSKFDTWRARTEEIADLHRQASNLQRTRHMGRHLRIWIERSQLYTHLDAQATYQLEMHIINISAAALRKIQVRLFHHQQEIQRANNLREWNDNRHFRNIFRHWRDKRASKDRTNLSILPLMVTATRNPFVNVLDGESQIRRDEDWTTLDDGFDIEDWKPVLEAQSSMTPMPGYLSTPSKRAARARALVRIAGTPSAQLKTPSERRSRMYQLSAVGSAMKRNRGYIEPADRGFEDIPEQSPAEADASTG